MRLFILFSILAISGCSHMANDRWSGQDKAQHFIASAMLSAAGNEYAQHQGNSRDRSAAIGLMFSVSPAHQRVMGQPSRWERLELERLRTGCCRCVYRLCGLATGTSLEAQTFPLPMQHQRYQNATIASAVTYQKNVVSIPTDFRDNATYSAEPPNRALATA